MIHAYATRIMSNIEQRIEQWEKMANEAPDAMSWFSLGNAYRDAERHMDAIDALRKAIEFDSTMSRAYQSLAQSLIQLGKNDEAEPVLTDGYKIATERGDVMPQKAMGSLLEKIGKPIPQIEQKQQEQVEITGDQVLDQRSGKPGNRLPDPPMRGPIGKYIYDHFSQETWREWIGQGTKVINELRLDFSNDEHQRIYETQMLEWLGFTRENADDHAKESGE